MKKFILLNNAFFLVFLSTSILAQEDQYFYCGYTNIDGSGRDYSKWGKNTDFKYNETKNRWEWITEFTNQYIYLNGKYEQETKVSFFENQIGECNKEMEEIYKQKIKDLIR